MTEVDARGLRCPWPALRAARALRLEPGPVRVAADDPAAAGELAALAQAAHRGFRALPGGTYEFDGAAAL